MQTKTKMETKMLVGKSPKNVLKKQRKSRPRQGEIIKKSPEKKKKREKSPET